MRTSNNRRWLQAWQLYDLVPMQAVSRLPDEGFPLMDIELTKEMFFRVWCKPKPPAGVRWGHRVMVRCDCGQDVPFGRMCQHYDSAKCEANRRALLAARS